MCGNVSGGIVLQPEGIYLIFIECDIQQIKFLQFQYTLWYSICWFTEILCYQSIQTL